MRSSKKSPSPKARAPQQADPETRLVVRIPESVHRKLKARAAEEGKSIKDYLMEILQEKGLG